LTVPFYMQKGLLCVTLMAMRFFGGCIDSRSGKILNYNIRMTVSAYSIIWRNCSLPALRDRESWCHLSLLFLDGLRFSTLLLLRPQSHQGGAFLQTKRSLRIGDMNVDLLKSPAIMQSNTCAKQPLLRRKRIPGAADALVR